jgi:hypothetical protein
MKGDKGLEQKIEFETKLRSLLGDYNKSLREVISILDPPLGSKPAKASSTPQKSTRKAHTVMVYKNPHTGEFISRQRAAITSSSKNGKQSTALTPLGRGFPDIPQTRHQAPYSPTCLGAAPSLWSGKTMG